MALAEKRAREGDRGRGGMHVGRRGRRVGGEKGGRI